MAQSEDAPLSPPQFYVHSLVLTNNIQGDLWQFVAIIYAIICVLISRMSGLKTVELALVK